MCCAWPEMTGKVECREGIRNVSARERPYAEEDGTELDQPGLTTVCAIPGPFGKPVRVGWRNRLNSGHRMPTIHVFGKEVFLARQLLRSVSSHYWWQGLIATHFGVYRG